jgi:hypothetical protein
MLCFSARQGRFKRQILDFQPGGQVFSAESRTPLESAAFSAGSAGFRGEIPSSYPVIRFFP